VPSTQAFSESFQKWTVKSDGLPPSPFCGQASSAGSVFASYAVAAAGPRHAAIGRDAKLLLIPMPLFHALNSPMPSFQAV